LTATATAKGGGVAVGRGVTTDANEVRFVGPWRPMREVAPTLPAMGGSVEVTVERWQILQRTRGLSAPFHTSVAPGRRRTQTLDVGRRL
jgi:hypothetical protein